MSTDSEPHSAALEHLSALMDGELDDTRVARACAHWRENAESRFTWHAYHLIGDVLRSDDLAVDPARDVAFLRAFRARLVIEPVVLAPLSHEKVPSAPARALIGARGSRWSWKVPTAVAAGFMAVAGVLVLARAPGTGTVPERSAGAGVDQVAAGGAPVATSAAIPIAGAGELPTFVASGQLIRDVRLDRYLAAHKQFAGSSALGVPSAFLRNATAEATGR